MTDTPDDAQLPDLDEVQTTIDSAHDAEDHLEEVMPDAIQPDDDGYAGMSGPTEGDVEETSEDVVETEDAKETERS